jgi:hypothetical protein
MFPMLTCGTQLSGGVMFSAVVGRELRAPITRWRRPFSCRWRAHSREQIVLGFRATSVASAGIVAYANASARLSQAFATESRAYHRLRNSGSQLVRVDHVHVTEGGQAVISNLKADVI